MDSTDERLIPMMNFVVKSFRLHPDKWEPSVANEDNLLTLNSFFKSPDHGCLFISEEKEEPPATAPETVAGTEMTPEPEDVTEPIPETPAPPPVTLLPTLRFSLGFPRDATSKVVCVSKPSREVVTKDTAKKLAFAEIPVDAALIQVTVLTEEIALLLLGNGKNGVDWPEGMPEGALRYMELLTNQVLVVKAQTQGRTFLPQPGLQEDSSVPEKDLGLKEENDLETGNNIEGAPLSNTNLSELLQACDWTIIEWAELVGEFLKRDSSELLLEQTRPLPEEEFSFWESRLQNLIFIDKQLKSTKAQRLAAIVENAQSVYSSTLKQVCSSVQSALKEAEDITHYLQPLQKRLEPLQTLDYPELKDQVETVMEEVRLLWTHSQFYCKPCRIVVLLQEISNLFMERSRSFLGYGQELNGLVSDPIPVLESVCLCIETLERLKECFRRCRAQLEEQGGNTPKWDFPSLLIFVHLDKFLEQLERIREVYRVTLDMSYLDQAILSGINGKKWTCLIEEVYSHFLHQLTVLAESDCNATNPNDQLFPELWAHFHSQVQDVESRLVTIFSVALERCTISTSAAKIVQMFGPVLKRPLILEKLHRHFNSVWHMIQKEVDQTELMVQNQIRVYKQSHEQNQVYSGFRPREVSLLTWIHQTEERVQHSYNNHLLIGAVEASRAHQVSDKCQSLKKLIQNFKDSVTTQWTKRLEKDCDFILQQPVIQLPQTGILDIPCGFKLEAMLRELRIVSQNKELKLQPQASHLFNCRDDITETHLSLIRLQSCYNQVVSSMDPVEQPLIQTQLQDLSRSLSRLQGWTWSSDGLLLEVQRQRDQALNFHQMITEARANTATIKQITEGWGQIQLLQCEEDGLLRGGITEISQFQLTQDSQELLRFTQENMSLYGAEDGTEAWLLYLDHIDDVVQSGLVQLLQAALSFLAVNMKRSEPPLLSVTLVLQPQGSRLVPSDLSAAGGVLSVEQRLSFIVSQLYSVTELVPRISTRRDSNYQPSLKQSPLLRALEQEVMSAAQEVSKTAEHLKAELDHKYSRLWASKRQDVMREFLTYGRQLGPDDQDVEAAPPTLKEFRREVQNLQSTRSALRAINDITVLQGWLQVDLRPFRDSVMSLTEEWSHMFTDRLLQVVEDSLQKVALEREDQPEPRFPLTQTLLLLEATGVELPPSLSKDIHC